MAKATKKKDKQEKVIVATPIGILSYPYLAAPDEGRAESSGKYSVNLYIPKTTFKKEGKQLVEAILKVGREFFEDDNLELEDFKNPIQDMDELDDLDQHEVGTIRIRAKSEYAPTVVGPQTSDVFNEKRVKEIKGGDYARLVVYVYPYTQKGGGVTLGLNLVQFVKPGKALGQGITASLKVIDDVEVEADDPEDMVDTEDDDTPPKKRRGRPKKTAARDEDEDTEEDEDDEEEETPRRAKSNGKAKRRARDEDEDEEEDEEEDETPRRASRNGVARGRSAGLGF